jgi:hypothetical protein
MVAKAFAKVLTKKEPLPRVQYMMTKIDKAYKKNDLQEK